MINWFILTEKHEMIQFFNLRAKKINQLIDQF